MIIFYIIKILYTILLYIIKIVGDCFFVFVNKVYFIVLLNIHTRIAVEKIILPVSSIN
jgi:hypothetical protein